MRISSISSRAQGQETRDSSQFGRGQVIVMVGFHDNNEGIFTSLIS